MLGLGLLGIVGHRQQYGLALLLGDLKCHLCGLLSLLVHDGKLQFVLVLHV